MKIGIVFAGQGSQYPGMGKDLYDNYAGARKVFDAAGEEIKKWCFEADKETLRQTHITQPTVYTVTMAAYEAFMESVQGIDLEIVGLAGFSLGEYAALTAGKSIESIAKGLEVVTERGRLMEQAGKDEQGNSKGSMVAAFGKTEQIEAAVEQARQGRILQAVNYNNPRQTVVAGEFAALEDFMATAKEARIKSKLLRVGTAFHCEMMAPAAENLLPVLQAVGFKAPTTKIYSNITAKDIMDGFAKSTEEEGKEKDVNAYLADVMARQVKSPVHFESVIRHMIADGAEAIVEVGPGDTLTGFVRKIDKEMPAFHVEDKASLEGTVAALKE